MPTYNFKKGEQVWEEFLSVSEMEQILAEDSSIELIPAAPAIHSGRGLGLRKPDVDFRSRLKQIKKSHPRSNVNEW